MEPIFQSIYEDILLSGPLQHARPFKNDGLLIF